jgi:hypothetical protein
LEWRRSYWKTSGRDAAPPPLIHGDADDVPAANLRAGIAGAPAIDVGSPARRATADIDFDGQSGSS